MEVKYHVFSDGCDDWYREFADALDQFRAYESEGRNARLYLELQDEQGEMLAESCLLSSGEYPL